MYVCFSVIYCTVPLANYPWQTRAPGSSILFLKFLHFFHKKFSSPLGWCSSSNLEQPIFYGGESCVLYLVGTTSFYYCAPVIFFYTAGRQAGCFVRSIIYIYIIYRWKKKEKKKLIKKKKKIHTRVLLASLSELLWMKYSLNTPTRSLTLSRALGSLTAPSSSIIFFFISIHHHFHSLWFNHHHDETFLCTRFYAWCVFLFEVCTLYIHVFIYFGMQKLEMTLLLHPAHLCPIQRGSIYLLQQIKIK